MPYHSSKEDLKIYLKEKELFSPERWQKLEDLGLTTLEEIAHYCSNGDIQQPQNENRLIEMVKEVEGDWTKPTPKLDEWGDEEWDGFDHEIPPLFGEAALPAIDLLPEEDQDLPAPVMITNTKANNIPASRHLPMYVVRMINDFQ